MDTATEVALLRTVLNQSEDDGDVLTLTRALADKTQALAGMVDDTADEEDDSEPEPNSEVVDSVPPDNGDNV